MFRLAFPAALALVCSGCFSSFATNLVADALSGPGTLGTDDDPELVRDAAPFGLKTMESVLQSQPKHVGLLTSLITEQVLMIFPAPRAIIRGATARATRKVLVRFVSSTSRHCASDISASGERR